MFCVPEGAPPSTVNISLNHNLNPWKCSQQSDVILFPFHLLCPATEEEEEEEENIFSFFNQITVTVFLSLPSKVMMLVRFSWPLVKKHLSRSISFPKAFPDRDRWCPFKRSHGSVLFLVLTTHTDTGKHTLPQMQTPGGVCICVRMQTLLKLIQYMQITRAAPRRVSVRDRGKEEAEPSLPRAKAQRCISHSAPFREPSADISFYGRPPTPYCFPAFQL